MLFELAAEVVDVAADGHRAGVTEHAEAVALDPVADLEQQVDLLERAEAGLLLAQQLGNPACALAARRALAARLVHVELGGPKREAHHAGAVVDDDHGAGAGHRAGGDDGLKGETRVNLVRHQNRHRGAARHERLERAAGGESPTLALDQIAVRRGQRHLVVAGVVDVAGQREHLGARRLLGADAGVGSAAHADDDRHRGDGLHVVEQRRLLEGARHGRERRLRRRLAAVAVERGQQRRLLTADVRASTTVHVDVGDVIGARQRRADVALLARLGDRALEDRGLLGVLTTDVDVRAGTADHPEVDDDPLDQHVRVAQDDLAVLERARLGLVAIDHEVAVDTLRQERRLATGGEASATTAAQVRRDHLVDELLARHAKRLAQRVVAAVLLILGNLATAAGERQQQRVCIGLGEGWCLRHGSHSVGRCCAGARGAARHPRS